MKHLVSKAGDFGGSNVTLRCYALALALACIAATLAEVLRWSVGLSIPFLLGLGAVMASSWIGGAGPGLVATAVMLVLGPVIGRASPWITTQYLVALACFSLAVAIAGEFVVRSRRNVKLRFEKVTQREVYLESIFENLSAALMIVDRSGNVRAANPSALRMFGLAESEIPDLCVRDLLRPVVDFDGDVMANLLSDAGPLQMTATAVDGSNLQLSVAAAPLKSGGRDLVALYFRDETPIRRAAEAMAEVQSSVAQLGRAAALGAMGSAIAHELNQPLASAANFAGAARSHLAQRENVPPQATVAIDAAIEQIVRASDILKGLRTFVQAAPVEPRWLRVHDIIREASQLGHFVMNDMRATLRTRIAPNVRFVWTDRVQIQQVLVNLLNNAAEAVADRDVRNVHISVALLSRDEAQVSVSDTGPGVAAGVRERLFEPFNTSKGQGLGVGLAISKSIVEAHGGRIWCEDGADGARFCLTLKHSQQGDAADARYEDHHLHHR